MSDVDKKIIPGVVQ